MDRTALAVRLRTLLTGTKKTLAIAESCTGGLLGGAVTAAAGASACFLGGVIAYDNRIKRDLLGVPARVLDKYGAVSREAVTAMARGARRLCAADYAIAVSGIAGPAGGTREKPVGTVWIGIAGKKFCRSFTFRFTGTRRQVRRKAVEKALGLLVRLLETPHSLLVFPA